MVSTEIKSETLFIWVHTAINALPLRMRFVPARSNIRLIVNINLSYTHCTDMLIIIIDYIVCSPFLFRPQKSQCASPEEGLSVGGAFLLPF